MWKGYDGTHRYFDVGEYTTEDQSFFEIGAQVLTYRGAFCDGIVLSLKRILNCKVKYNNGKEEEVREEHIKGFIEVGSIAQVRAANLSIDLKATIQEIKDYSEYIIEFPCNSTYPLKRHHIELRKEIDFRSSSKLHCKSAYVMDIGKVVSVADVSRNYEFPALIVFPTILPKLRVNVRHQYLLKSFHDSRLYVQSKSNVSEFVYKKLTQSDYVQDANENARKYLETDELPTDWSPKELLHRFHTGDGDEFDEIENELMDLLL